MGLAMMSRSIETHTYTHMKRKRNFIEYGNDDDDDNCQYLILFGWMNDYYYYLFIEEGVANPFGDIVFLIAMRDPLSTYRFQN